MGNSLACFACLFACLLVDASLCNILPYPAYIILHSGVECIPLHWYIFSYSHPAHLILIDKRRRRSTLMKHWTYSNSLSKSYGRLHLFSKKLSICFFKKHLKNFCYHVLSLKVNQCPYPFHLAIFVFNLVRKKQLIAV